MITRAQKSLLVYSGLVGLLGALLVGGGEFLLQFSPDGGYADPEYRWMASIPVSRLTLGHFLAILSAPLYLVGYWHLGQMLKPGGVRAARLVTLMGGYGFMVGAVWIGQRAFLGVTARAIADGSAAPDLLHTMAGLNEPLVNVLRIVMVVVSLIWIVQIARGHTHYPRFMVLFSPAALLAAIFALFFWQPQIGNFTMPTAMNTAHAVLFALSTLVALSLRAKTEEKPEKEETEKEA